MVNAADAAILYPMGHGDAYGHYTRLHDATVIGPLMRNLADQAAVLELDATLSDLQQTLYTINQRLQELDDAVRNYQTLSAQGDRMQAEREVYRQRTSAVVQGYLVRVGVDSMHSPPLGDTSDIRSWTVDDVAIPLPFNIGASQFSSGGFYQSSDFLSEPLITVRKHQAFRPVPSASYFSTSLTARAARCSAPNTPITGSLT